MDDEQAHLAVHDEEARAIKAIKLYVEHQQKMIIAIFVFLAFVFVNNVYMLYRIHSINRRLQALEETEGGGS